MNARKQKGEQIAKMAQIQKQGLDKWIVPSQTTSAKYTVNRMGEDFRCSCPDFQNRSQACKHIYAVEIKVLKWYDNEGNSGATITIKKTYTQDWTNYTKAQNEEGRLFKVLLKDLVQNVEEPVRIGAGRPSVPRSEALFCAIDKVYSMQSSRRAYSRYKDAEAKEQIRKAPSYNVINITLNDAEITPILRELLHITALPLKSVETKFSPDSTGFRTTKFNEYCKEKHDTKKKHKFIKCHAITGNSTNIVVDAIINESGGDSPQFIPLVNETDRLGFDMQEVSADKGYSSIDNYNAVQKVGGTAYIPFKSNTTALSNTGNRARLWRKMFHYFQLNNEDFLAHYHNRSNVETTFWAIKAKFGDCLKNKNMVSQTNEVLCKLIAYNITVLISAMYELKIEPNLICSEISTSAQ